VWAEASTSEFGGRKLGRHWADRRTTSTSRKCSKVGDRRASQVRRGTLRLRVMVNPDRRGDSCRIRQGPDKGSYRHYLNGQVSTQHVPHAFTFGTFAARVKFPRTRGKHGAFWLQTMNRRYLKGRPGKSGAEIDIAEFFGQGYPEGGFASFLYNYGIKAGTKKIGGLAPSATRMLPRGDAWWKSYHVVSLEWTKRAYIFRVDGRQHWRTRRGVSRIDEYLILSLLSSDWELRQAKKLGINPEGTMHVDWARVWQK
jgi:beta-glucanase (GH16 family)